MSLRSSKKKKTLRTNLNEGCRARGDVEIAFDGINNLESAKKNLMTIIVCLQLQHLYKFFEGRKESTLSSCKMPLGSLVTSQPSRQPGTIHLFDIDPRVMTGTVDPNTPIRT